MTRTMPDGPEPGPFRLADSASHLLHRAEQLAGDRFTQLVGETVTLRQFAALAAIAETPGLSQANLVRTTGIDRSTFADMMNRMEKRGWIARTASMLDARAHCVHLAPAGEAILTAATQHARAADAAILDALPRAKRKTFLNTLTKLAKFSDETAAKAEHEARRQAKREVRRKEREKMRRNIKRDNARKQRT